MQFEDLYARQRGLRHLLQDEQNPFSLMTVLRFACRWVSRLILPVWRWRSNVLGETKRGPSQAWRRRLKIAKEKALNYKRKPISFHRWHKSRRVFYDDHLSPCSYQWKRFHTQQREWLRNMSDLLNRRVRTERPVSPVLPPATEMNPDASESCADWECATCATFSAGLSPERINTVWMVPTKYTGTHCTITREKEMIVAGRLTHLKRRSRAGIAMGLMLLLLSMPAAVILLRPRVIF